MSKIKKMKQIHGKVEDFQPTTLDQVWGDNGLNKYKTLDESTYTKDLADYNLSDLQAHAAKIGIVPTDNREILTKKLLKEFRSYAAQYRFPKEPPSVNKKLSAEASKILSEGR